MTAELPTEAEPTPGLYTLTDTKTVSFLSGIEEKSFLVSDEAELPAGCPPMEKLLCYSHTETVEELKQVGGKMILQGTVRLDTLYLTAGDDAPQQQSFRIPFSQILDIANGKAELSTVILTSGGCYLEPLSGQRRHNLAAFGAAPVRADALPQRDGDPVYRGRLQSQKRLPPENRRHLHAEYGASVGPSAVGA